MTVLLFIFGTQDVSTPTKDLNTESLKEMPPLETESMPKLRASKSMWFVHVFDENLEPRVQLIGRRPPTQEDLQVLKNLVTAPWTLDLGLSVAVSKQISE